MVPVLWIALGLLALRLAASLVLSALNRAEVRRNAVSAPPAVAATMDAATYRRAVDYTLARSRFGMLSEVFDTLVLALALLGGILPLLFNEVAVWGGPDSTWNHALFVLLAGMLLAIPSLPFEWWEQFRLEQRFGFNQSTPRLWVTDKLKGLGLMFLLGFPLLWALLSLVRWVGGAWWLWGFALSQAHPSPLQQAYSLAGRTVAGPAARAGRPHRIPGAGDRGHRRLQALGAFERVLHGLRPLPADRAVRHPGGPADP